MYDVLDVSRFIINYCNQKEYIISNSRLQALLYFIQAKFLLAYNEPCFKEDIEAWELGVCIPSAYKEFAGFGANHIPPITHYYDAIDKSKPYFSFNNYGIIKYKDNILEKEHQEEIVKIIEDLRKYWYLLREITTRQTPYKKAKKRYNKRILNDDIIEYYKPKENKASFSFK